MAVYSGEQLGPDGPLVFRNGDCSVHCKCFSEVHHANKVVESSVLTLLHSERPKLRRVLAVLSAVELKKIC